MHWSIRAAQSSFGEMLETCLREGPQVVTRRGEAVAVLVPIHEWRRFQDVRPSLKALLLADTTRAEIPLPPRGIALRRVPPAFE